MATQTLLAEQLSKAPPSDPVGMYYTGSEWLPGPPPAKVTPTSVPVKLWPTAAAPPPRHPRAARRVVFRSQCARLDWRAKWAASTKAAPSLQIQSPKAYVEPEKDGLEEKLRREAAEELPAGAEEVVIDGAPYVQYGADLGGRKLEAGPLRGKVVSAIDVPPLARVARHPDVMPLYDCEGNLKKEGDAPLGVAYDAEGLPVPDWDVVEECDGQGRAFIDGRGQRHAKIEVRGSLEDAVLLDTKRAFPVWGKRFGLVTRKRVGRVGTLTVEKAKDCLEKESFGFRMAEAVNVPPLIELRYGEVHNECASVTIVAGLSELHLSHKENIQDVHYMLMGLGYVSYTPVDQDQTGEEVPRFWGEGISTAPSKHYAGDGGAVSIKQQGPTYYTWHYRLPPFVEGLALEGEAGDPRGGPEALLRAARLKKLELQQEQLQEERATALRARVAEAAKQPWYRDYFPDGEVDPATGEVVNAPGTLPGEVAIAPCDADDKE